MAKRNSARKAATDGPVDDDQVEEVLEEEDETETDPDMAEGNDDDAKDPDAMEGDEDEDEEDGDEEDVDDAPNSEPKAKSERKRIAAILNSPEGKANAKLANHLAFNTGQSAKSARATLKAAGPSSSGKGRLSKAFRAEDPNLSPGGASGGKSGPSSADLMKAKYAKT